MSVNIRLWPPYQRGEHATHWIGKPVTTLRTATIVTNEERRFDWATITEKKK